MFRKAIRWLDDWAEEFAVSVLMSALVIFLGAEVFSRFILGHSFSWMEELCRYFFVWACYLGIGLAIKRKEQIRILVLVDFLAKHRPAWVKYVYVASETCFLIFCVATFYYSINLLENMIQFKQVSGSLEIDKFYPYLILPISMADTSFRIVQRVWRDFKNNTLTFTNEEQAES